MTNPSLPGQGAGAEGPLFGDPRERVGWYFYDWANSAFATSVVTVFLGPYLTTIAKAAADSRGEIAPLGLGIKAGSFFPYVVSISVLTQVIFLPILGGLADYSHRKKEMLGLFAYLGAFSTMGFYYLDGTNYLFGALLFLIANLSFGASLVFYNAFLPEIAAPNERNRVSSRGWAMGYLGGGLLLAMNLVLVSLAGDLGLTTSEAVRISLASAGTWWAIFTLIPLARLKTRRPIKALPSGNHYLTIGFSQLRHTLLNCRRYPQTLRFLGAYLLYNDGIQTVIALSSQFGQEALGIPISTLTAIILMVQFVAFFGAIFFEYVAAAINTKRAIIVSLLIWIGILIYAAGFLESTLQFVILAAVIAMVLGGSQALSRSVYSLMIPQGCEAEYFSLYEVSERGTSWLGPLLFGLAFQYTGSYRIALFSLVVFFVLGLTVFLKVNIHRAAIEAGNAPPVSASD
ncbi:MAG: MFS transporter [Nitrospiria bacterium]